MKKIDVIKVDNKQRMDDFLKVTKIVYKGCDQYVPDLESDVRNIFRPEKNPGIKFSIIQPFVACIPDSCNTAVQLADRNGDGVCDILKLHLHVPEVVRHSRRALAFCLQVLCFIGKGGC